MEGKVPSLQPLASCVRPERALYWHQSPWLQKLMVSLHVDRRPIHHVKGVLSMEWTKPEFTVVAVTMEVTAYAATK